MDACLEIDHHRFPHSFAVAELGVGQGILGLDFLDTYDCSVHVRTATLQIADATFRLSSNYKSGDPKQPTEPKAVPAQVRTLRNQHADHASSPAGDGWLDTWTADQLRAWQQEDGPIQTLLQWKAKDQRKPKWSEVADQSRAVKTLWAQWEHLEVQEGVLYRKWSPRPGLSHQIRQLVAPKQLRNELLQQLHKNRLGSHLGVIKTRANIRRGFYWPGYSDDVERWCYKCRVCQLRKMGPSHRRAQHRHQRGRRAGNSGQQDQKRRKQQPARDEFEVSPDLVLEPGDIELHAGGTPLTPGRKSCKSTSREKPPVDNPKGGRA